MSGGCCGAFMFVFKQQCKVAQSHTPIPTYTHTHIPPTTHTHTHLATHTYMYIYLNPADSLVFMARPLDEHILHARTLTVHMLGMMGVHRHCPGLVCLCDSQRQKQKLQTGSQNCTHEQKVHTAILICFIYTIAVSKHALRHTSWQRRHEQLEPFS